MCLYKKNLMLVGVLLATSSFAEGFTTTEYVSVTSSKPFYTTINEEVPTEQCRDVKEAVSSSGSGHNDAIGAVVGGAAGGVLGNQIGGGKGKTAATIGGAVLGALAGQNVGSKYNTPSSTSYQTVRKCETVYTSRTRKVNDGYVNTAKLKGKTISVQSDKPLKQIPVTVTYSY